MHNESYLDRLTIATPCRAKWERMDAVDETGAVRFCRSCEKNVYNVSLMSRFDAEALLRRYEGDLAVGNLCVGFVRRADGTIITNDCPIGQSQVRQTRINAVMLVALFLIAVPNVVGKGLRRVTGWTLRQFPPIAELQKSPRGRVVFLWLDAPDPPPAQEFFGGAATQLN